MDFWVDSETLIIRASGPAGYECSFEGQSTCTKVIATINQAKAKAIRDSDGTITIIENPDLSYLYVDIRNKRNALLAACDWTRLDDVETNKEAWAVYRQALRDITKTTTDPTNVTWPVPPS